MQQGRSTYRGYDTFTRPVKTQVKLNMKKGCRSSNIQQRRYWQRIPPERGKNQFIVSMWLLAGLPVPNIILNFAYLHIRSSDKEATHCHNSKNFQRIEFLCLVSSLPTRRQYFNVQPFRLIFFGNLYTACIPLGTWFLLSRICENNIYFNTYLEIIPSSC